MEYHRVGDALKVRLLRDFNLLTARRIEPLARDVKRVEIDLTRSKLVDSEAITLLYRLIETGKEVHLYNPPPLFYEALRILDLEDFFNMNILIEQPLPAGPTRDSYASSTPTD